VPENCLRNSYATYAQTFRSSGDVTRAMGDAEGTVKRFYVQTLEPAVGELVQSSGGLVKRGFKKTFLRGEAVPQVVHPATHRP
jgi:hypothetical protein